MRSPLRPFVPALLAAVLLTVAPFAAPSASPRTVVLSLRGLDCASCFEEVATELEKVKGVRRTSFDRRKVEAAVEVEGAVPVSALLAAVVRAGFTAIEGPGHGRWLPPEGFAAGADATIAVKAGEDLPDLAPILVPGKITVVDFYADWCGPCRQVDRHMKGVLAAREDVALRKVNIVDWETPIAKRWLKNASGIPYLMVFGPNGRRIATIQGLKLDQLDAAVARAGKS